MIKAFSPVIIWVYKMIETEDMISSKRLYLIILVAALSIYVYQNIYLAWQHYHTNDFKHMYLGAKMLRYNIDPYDPALFFQHAQYEGFDRINPFVYPSFSGVFFMPLSFFSFEKARLLWFVLNHVFIGAALLLCMRYILPRPVLRWSTFLLAAAAVSHPLYRTLTAGQMNAFLLLLYTVIFIAWKKNRGHWLAFLIALGGMVKILPFFMGILLLERKNWKYLCDFFGWLLVLNLLSIILCGWETHLEYFNILAQMGFGSSAWYEFGARFHTDPSNQSLAAFLLRNFTDQSGLSRPLLVLPLNTVSVLFYCFALTAVGYCFILLLKLSRQNEYYRFLFFIQVMLINFLVPTIVWDHYFMILFPVIALQIYLFMPGPPMLFSLQRFLIFLLPGFLLLIFPQLFTGFAWDSYIVSYILFTILSAVLFSSIQFRLSTVMHLLFVATWMGWALRFPYFLPVFTQGAHIFIASNKFYLLGINLLIVIYMQWKFKKKFLLEGQG